MAKSVQSRGIPTELIPAWIETDPLTKPEWLLSPVFQRLRPGPLICGPMSSVWRRQSHQADTESTECIRSSTEKNFAVTSIGVRYGMRSDRDRQRARAKRHDLCSVKLGLRSVDSVSAGLLIPALEGVWNHLRQNKLRALVRESDDDAAGAPRHTPPLGM